MDNKLDEQILIIQDLIYDNKRVAKETNNTLNKHESYFTKINRILSNLMLHNQNTSPEKADFSKDQDPDSVVPYNNKYQPLEGGNSMQIGGICTPKNEINSPELYEILLKT